MSPIEPERVSFLSRNLKLAGHFYSPSETAPDRTGAAIVICPPWTSIKEQSPGNYARVLSQAGFFCLAFDAAYQGESEGEPRHLEDPYQRIEEIKNAVTYLIGRNEVNGQRIGVLGICTAGGYAAVATQTDLRLRACATSAAVCLGTLARRGFDKDASNMKMLRAQLGNAARDRTSDASRGEKEAPRLMYILPERYEDVTDDYPESMRDLASYYRTLRGFHPRATQACLVRSWDMMAAFDAFAFNSMISPRPLLMITGDKAATRWYSEEGITKAEEPKELFVVDSLTHADLYDKVDVAGAKLVEFFGQYLG